MRPVERSVLTALTIEASKALPPAGDRLRRYRYRTAVLVGRWRATRDAAIDDAVAAQQAFRGPDEPSGVTWIVPGRIEEHEG